MLHSIRNHVTSVLSEVLHFKGDANAMNCINAALSLKSLTSDTPQIHLKVKDLKSALARGNVDQATIKSIQLSELSQLTLDQSLVLSTTAKNDGLVFNLNLQSLMRDTFEHQHNVKLFDEPQETVIVEFSSPNIAKPFHMGHLRSTIIGNCLANMIEAYEHKVIRINYLGDWGTQFGFLKLGMDMANVSDDEMRQNPIKHLFNAYVNANRLAETDESFGERARTIFSQMENGELPDLDAWNQYRAYTVTELESVYQRLGVKFDVYAWESQYRKTKIQSTLDKLREMNLLRTENDGKQTFELDDARRIPLLKSDGSTLYLTRDVAAVADRYETYKFDRMYYVVGNEQHQHFQALFQIVDRLGVLDADKLRHIKFGRVEKMSTRKGNVVFLTDLLDEIKELMESKQQESATTKIDLDSDHHTADIVGVSALIIHELQRAPTSSYAFDLEAVLNDINNRRSFQYTHCRLCSLEEHFGWLCTSDVQCDPTYLLEPDAVNLIVGIAQFQQVLFNSKQTLAPQYLVKYMHSLTKRISKAVKVLNIKNETNDRLRMQRMLLFRMARNTLGKCMRLIGVTPLTKM